MRIQYDFDMDESTQSLLDGALYEYGLDVYIWWENQEKSLLTDHMPIVTDLEKIFEDLHIAYNKTVTE